MKKKYITLLFCAMCLLIFIALFFIPRDTDDSPEEKPLEEEDTPSVYEKMLSSAVALSCDIDGGDFWGSGIVVGDPDSPMILTCYHVVFDADRIGVKAYMNEDDSGEDAECIWYSREYDLALLSCDTLHEAYPELRAATFGDGVCEGQTVHAVGNFDGKGIALNSGAVSRRWETVSAIPPYGTETMDMRLIRFGIPISEGCSGGALFDAEGRVAGVINSRNALTRMGWAIPAESVSALLESYKKSGEAKRLDMGCTLKQGSSPITDEPSVEIVHVESGSLSETLFSEGDRIYGVEINGISHTVGTPVQMDALLIGLSEGDRVTFFCISNGERKTVDTTVNEMLLETID